MILAGIWETTIADETVDVLVAERDGEVVGWANASCARDDRAPTDRELQGIYVVRAVYGSGTGQRLLDAIIGDARTSAAARRQRAGRGVLHEERLPQGRKRAQGGVRRSDRRHRAYGACTRDADVTPNEMLTVVVLLALAGLLLGVRSADRRRRRRTGSVLSGMATTFDEMFHPEAARASEIREVQQELPADIGASGDPQDPVGSRNPSSRPGAESRRRGHSGHSPLSQGPERGENAVEDDVPRGT